MVEVLEEEEDNDDEAEYEDYCKGSLAIESRPVKVANTKIDPPLVSSGA